MAIIPAYSAARNGLLGDTGAMDASAQINQLLGSHGITVLYGGAQILTPNGAALGSNVPASFWSCHLDGTDYDQPFTMPGTAIGRVTVPVLPVGAGADLIVSLCPDSAGNPGTPIATTRIPAAWITQLAAVAGAAGPSSSLQLTTPTSAPLALPQFNALLFGQGVSYNWSPPAPTSAGAISFPPAIGSGNYMILAGGSIGSNGAQNVYTVPWLGGATLGAPIAQPLLPEPLGLTALSANSTTIITAGGVANSSTLVASVYTAGWNPATGQISAWSQQTPLPQAVGAAFGAATDSAVYVVGGQNNTPAVLNTVYWATLSNGQVSAWQTGTPLPVSMKGAFVAIIGSYLVVVGGDTNVGLTAASNAVYYAAINADNSLGPWQSGPAMPYAVGNGNSGFMVSTSAGIAIIGGFTPPSGTSTEIQNLSFGPDGPGVWSLSTLAAPDGNAVFPIGPGQWQVFSLYSTSYATASQYQVPQISVPLPATGLTNGGTYHVLMRQAGGDLNDYLRMPMQYQPFPGFPTVQSRASSGGSTWTAGTSGDAIPITIYDQTASGSPLHFWSDVGARHSMLVNTTTPDGSLLGILEATAQSGPVLNMNATFTAGTAPWAATGGALAQSSAHTHGNLPFSAQLTPSGSAATSQIESEKVAVLQSHSYTVTAWLYSNPGYSNSSLSINWYNSSGTLLSTTAGTTTPLAAATWTQVVTTGNVPSGAATATIVAAEGGTPSSSAVLFVSSATMQDTSGPMLPAVSQISYSAGWPAAVGAPLSITQLA